MWCLGVLGLTSPRVLRRLYWLRDRDPVPDDLRGWCWDRRPVRPKAYFGLGVSEVAYRYCEVFRDLWLRRRGGVKPVVEKGSLLWWGSVVHAVMDYACSDVRRLLDKGYPPWRVYEEASKLALRRAREAGAEGDRRITGFYKSVVMLLLAQTTIYSMLHDNTSYSMITPITEFRIDGTPLGLSSRLRVDAVTGMGVVVEFKYGGKGNGRHKIGLAGYALALESMVELPVDFGVLVYINDLDNPRLTMEPVYIDARLRRSFLENRDEAIDTLMMARPPEPLENCSRTCPFYKYCHGGAVA